MSRRAPKPERENQVHMRLSDHEVECLRLLAADKGITRSGWVRMMIRQQYEQNPNFAVRRGRAAK